MKRVVVAMLFGLLITTMAWADYEAAMEAYKKADYAAALKELKPLADQGDARAQNTLGWMYREGQGAAKDYNEAIKWFEKAAAQGFAKAINNLGILYEKELASRRTGRRP